MRIPPAVVLSAVTASLLAACTQPTDDAASQASAATAPASPAVSAHASGGSGTKSTQTGPKDGATSAAEAAEPPPAPPGKGCYRVSLGDLTEPTNDSKPVPCKRRHNAQTIYVGKLDTVVDGHLVAVDSKTVQRQVSAACPRRLAAFVGGDRARRMLSKFEVVWFAPTLEQADLGANWFRCDLVAFATSDRLSRLPATRRLRGALDTSTGLGSYGICGTSAPGTKGFERVICAKAHSWRAVSTVPISGGARFPGPNVVRESGDETCRDLVQDLAGSVTRFQYGWEWPSREQWDRGQHYGFCWAPD